MTSNCDHNIGDIISINQPFVHLLKWNYKNQYCDYCLKKCSDLKKCNACKQQYYCGKKCQKLDWKKHKYECEIYATYENDDHFKIDNDLNRFLLRLYLFIDNNPDSLLERRQFQNNQSKDFDRCFMDLQTNREEIRMHLPRMNVFEKLYKRFKSLNRLNIDYDKLFEYYCRICINSFTITNCELNEIGTGLYLSESKLDHSCVPNAALVFNGNKIIIRAIRPIKIGEMITINYVDIKLSKETRQEKLFEQYYFQCECIRCSSWEPLVDYEQLAYLIKKMDESIDQEKFADAYEYGLQTMPMFRKIYDKCHPDLTVQLLRMLKLHLQILPEINHETMNDEIILKEIADTRQAIEWTNSGADDELYQTFVSLFRS